MRLIVGENGIRKVGEVWDESIYMGNDLGIDIPCCANRMGEMAQKVVKVTGKLPAS